MKFKLVIAAVLTFFVGAMASLPSAIAGNDLSWISTTSKDYYEPSAHAFAFTDKSALPWNFSVLQGGTDGGQEVCTSSNDAVCRPGKYVKFNSILKACTTTSETNCIAEVNAIDVSGKSSPATFSQYTVKNHLNAYPADSKLGIPAGDVPSIWSIPSAPHASGNDYAVIAGVNGDVGRDGSESFIGTYMQISFLPVVLRDYGKGRSSIAEGWSQAKPGIYYDYCTTFQQTGQAKGPDCNHVNGPECVLPTNDQGMCYAEEAFGTVQKFNLQIRLAKEPTGWLHGRMIDPTISITNSGTSGVSLSVTAGATKVPMVYQNATWNTLSPTVQNLWVKCYADMRLCGEYNFYRGMSTAPKFETLESLSGQSAVNILHYIKASGPLPLEILSTIAPLFGDKATAESTTWSLRSLAKNEMNGANSCFTDTPGLKGIVSTNSTAYSAGPPEFKDGTLNYQVSAPHFNTDGSTPFKGNYNLVMRSDTARCIYGFSKAPINATISILSSEGVTDISTSTLKETNGWLYLNANNFEFSAPVIKIKLSQDAAVAPPAPSPSASASAAPVAAKKTSITCVKGKTTKKVLGIKPTCPKGFKLK
jgi:hypothetical protein